MKSILQLEEDIISLHDELESLREVVDIKQLSFFYQPQIDIETGSVVGVEALSYWTHSELGVVSLVEFIEISERIDMIKQLTECVMH
jgi:EAL domain-containing protein (putative c-di-GMP-specific phosphodiesterase class I)